MALVSISKAARLAGLSRTQLYRGYIDKGKLSTVTAEGQSPQIDTSELLRVFGSLKESDSNGTATGQTVLPRPVTPVKTDTDTVVLKQKVKHLEELLQARDKLLQEKDERIGELKQALTRLEHIALIPVTPIADPPVSVAAVQEVVADPPPPRADELLQRVTADQGKKRGFWSRIFGG